MPIYAPVRERFSMLYEPFGGSAQTWSNIAFCHPAGPDMVTFMQQQPALVAAFVHCCYLMRYHHDIDPESLFSSHSIAQVIDDADEFFSAVSSLPVYQSRAAGPPTKEPNKAHGVHKVKKKKHFFLRLLKTLVMSVI
jgi:hypothetical protein